MLSSHAVRLPESFRGGCSFGAGVKADLSRRDCLEQIGRKHGWTRAVNAAAASYQGICKGFAKVLRWCGKSLIRCTLSGQRWLACLKAERPRRGQQKWKPVLRRPRAK